MRRCQPSLPAVWLISDVRNDAALERALRRLPRGSGFVFRHYHLDPPARRARFDALARIARARGHLVILAGDAAEAARWGADGHYGAHAQARASGGRRAAARGTRSPPARRAVDPERPACRPAEAPGRRLVLMTAHSLREIARCRAADAILLSPVFPTRSHPGAKALGPLRFRLLAARAQAPVVALGGMDARRARRLRHRNWAAIDGLCDQSIARIPQDS